MSGAHFDHFVFGSLHIELRGSGIASVIAQMHQAGARLEHVRVHGHHGTMVIGLNDFWPLYRACRTHRVKLRILARQGMPFVVRHMKRRKMMVFGAVSFVGLLFVMSSVIWQVSVSGVQEETMQAVLQAAKESGLYVGAWRSSVRDLAAVQARMLQQMPSLVWAGIEVNGSKASVKVIERVKGVDQAPVVPHNLVASKPAVIQKVFATRGNVLVHPGQVVQPGQVVVSGDLGQGKLVPAEGQVWAEVWYTSNVTLPLSVTQQDLTGLSSSHEDLTVGSISLRILGWQQPQYPMSTESVSETDWHIGSFRLPVQWRKVTDYEVANWAVSKTTKEAEQAAKRLAMQDVQAQIGKETTILGQTVLQSHISHGKLYATVLTRVEEDIGVSAPIPKPAPPQTS